MTFGLRRFELRTKVSFSYRQKIEYKIRTVLKLLAFREQHVLVQFWSPCIVGNKQLLKSLHQPYGIGVVSEELCFYRRDSENNTFLVNKGHEEYNLSPPARVFSRELPEWSLDLIHYNPKDFPLQESALRCNLHGYLALPVFDSTTGLCVGVIELLTSFTYVGYAFEVQQVHRALKTENLTSPQAYDSPTSKVPNERRQNKLDKISGILKTVCDTHSLPLAQTWAVSPTSTFVSHNKVIEKTCSSFDSRCIGKVCMSTTSLPYHVRDLDKWHFREACKQQHLDKFRGFVGRALLSHGSCYCQDVTELSEEEYPLVHNARISRLSSSFTIFLHSVEGDYDEFVLEFFLLLDNEDGRLVLNLVETLKHEVEVASAFELGGVSPIDVFGPPSDVSYLSLSIKPHTIQISSATYEMYSCDSESSFDNFATTSKNHPLKQYKGKIDSVTSKRFCLEGGFSSLPMPQQKHLQHSSSSCLAIRVAVFVVLKAKRWSCSSKKHKFYGRWWSCGKHRYLPSKLSQPGLYHTGKPEHNTNIVSTYLDDQRLSCSGFVDANPKPSVNNVLNMGLTVKAMFKDDMIKFHFPISSGLSELENEVARRLNVKGRRLCLNYKGEGNDLVPITCDAELQTLPEILSGNTIVKLLVQLAHD
uniref:protein NLP7-like isoform X2 n=1 Tax=Erigeron canadensis TaxID=72917 RepID=UPI001CB8B977|nr:protein NLP7-like isoform X2 [Erigeron canadensis]